MDRKRCYYCGDPTTGRQHIPPLSFFPKDDRDHQLFTVPSCKAHNQAFKDQEAEFRTFLVSSYGVSKSARKVLKKCVLNPNVRGEAHIKKLKDGLTMAEIEVNGLVQKAPLIAWDRGVINDFLTAMTRGLTMRFFPTHWSPAMYFCVRQLNPPGGSPSRDAVAALMPQMNRIMKSDVFAVAYANVRDIDYFRGLWVYMFYNQIEFCVHSSTRSDPVLTD